MPVTLLATKLSIPSRGKYLVDRPTLITRLHECLDLSYRLALISAPAGFGKTSLASAWVNTLKLQGNESAPLVAWVSLDSGDNDPVIFWSYIISSIQAQQEGIGKQSINLLQTAQATDLEGNLALLINDLAQNPNPIVLVLDDYHLIRDQAIHHSLSFFIDHAPSQFHVMILSRTDPPLPLALLRGRGQLLEIRMKDLRFTLEDANSFLNPGMGLNLAAQAVETLHGKTEGWVAGLQMAALSLREAASSGDQKRIDQFIAAFSGSNRYILDYLMEEVLNHQPVEIQNFLLRTSILDRLCGPLCDAIVGTFEGWNVSTLSPPDREDPSYSSDQRSNEILEYLDRANLFVFPLDDQRYWYRYHQLFAELLKKRLSQTDPGLAPGLHQRAIQWYEQNGLIQKAVGHALLIKDHPKAAALISQVVEEMWGRGEHATLLEWIAALPEEEKRNYPQLWVFQVSMLITAGKIQEAESCVQEIESYLSSSLATNPEQASLMGRVFSLRTYIASFYGDIPNLLHYAQLALENLNRDEDAGGRSGILLVMSNAYLTTGELKAAGQALVEAMEAGKKARRPSMVLTAIENLVIVLCIQGGLTRAGQVCQEGLQLVQQNGLDQSSMAANLFIGQGLILCERHELDEAEKYIHQGLELARERSYIWSIAWGCRALIRLLLAKEDLAAAEAVIQEADDLIRSHEIPEHHTCGISGLKARVWLRLGKIEQAEGYLQARQIWLNGDIQYPHETEYLALASLCHVKGDLEAGADLLERMLQRVEPGMQPLWAIRLLALQALLYRVQGKRELSLGALSKALGLAEPEGYVQTFIDEGESMVDLLAEAVKENIHPEYANQLRQAFLDIQNKSQPVADNQSRSPVVFAPGVQPTQAKINQTGEDGWIETLTHREIEIVQLIEEGYSNKEIAQKLFISLRTVKFYATNIYAKLGVTGRTQAVHKARELGLL